MSSEKPPSAAPILRIEGEMTIFRAAELKQILLADPPAVEVDLAGVNEIDSAGLQLLMLARKTAQAQGRAFRLVALSPAVSDLLGLLRVSAYFDAPPATSGETSR